MIEQDANRIGMTMMMLQNPVKSRLESITQDLKEVTKAQKAFGKALDKVGYRDLIAAAAATATDRLRRSLTAIFPWRPMPWLTTRA